jgi:hypothetical protein
VGWTERREALGAYGTGLLPDGERKSMEPIAARLVDDPVAFPNVPASGASRESRETIMARVLIASSEPRR